MNENKYMVFLRTKGEGTLALHFSGYGENEQAKLFTVKEVKTLSLVLFGAECRLPSPQHPIARLSDWDTPHPFRENRVTTLSVMEVW